MKPVNCDICVQTFSCKSNLFRHNRNVHGTGFHKIRCNSCEFVTSKLDNLKRHKRENHNKLPKNPKICPLCKFTTAKEQTILDHFEHEHKAQFITETHEFESLDQFHKWKSNLEHEENLRFVVKSTSCSSHGIKKLSFRCYRDGCTSSSAVKRQMTRSSVKINGVCPAKILVEVTPNGFIRVVFQKTHVGHDNETTFLRLSKTKRNLLASKIASNIPFGKILEKIKTSDEFVKFNFISKKHLHNIARDYNLRNQAVVDDILPSIDSWVKKLKKDQIAFYKSRGTFADEFPELKENDFLLIVIDPVQVELCRKFGSKFLFLDSTVGMTQRDFEICTVITMDDYNHGFPGAFMFSNKIDSITTNVFATVVRDTVGMILKPLVLMTNTSEEMYNAWVSIMNLPNIRLWAPWCVEKELRDNLALVTGGTEKRNQVNDMLQTLLNEKNIETFEQTLSKTVNILNSDPETIRFFQFFNQKYASATQSWAFCYRYQLNLNLDHLQGIIKNLYFKSHRFKLLDLTLQSIFRLMKNKPSKQNLSSKLAIIRQKHNASLKINCINKIDSFTWRINSNCGLSEVKKTTDCGCGLLCYECQVCLHKYVCSCLDSTVKLNMCKHIHAVVRNISCNETVGNFTDTENELGNSNNNLKGKKDNLVKEVTELIQTADSLESFKIVEEMIRNAKIALQNQSFRT